MPTAPSRIHTFDQILGALDTLGDTSHADPHSLARALAHCAQSIELAIDGYPVHKPAWFKATVGRAASRAFILLGFMRHDTDAPVPGAAEPLEVAPDAAIARLRAAIARFRAHPGALREHFFYGPLRRPDCERIHAMHVANHLIALGA